MRWRRKPLLICRPGHARAAEARALQAGLRAGNAAREALRPRSRAARRRSSSSQVPQYCRTARQLMNGSDEASPRRRRPGLRFPDLGARSHIRLLPPRGTEGSNPAPSSGESLSTGGLTDSWRLGVAFLRVKTPRATPRLPIAVCGHAASGAARPFRELASTRPLAAVCDRNRSPLPSSNAAPNKPAR